MEWLGLGLLLLGVLALLGMYGWDYHRRRQQVQAEQERAQWLVDRSDTEAVGEPRRISGGQVEPIFGVPEDEAPPLPRQPAVPETSDTEPPSEWIIQLSLVSLEPGGYLGDVVMQALDELGLEYGAMRIFHRYAGSTPSGQPRELRFSVANLVKPGYFIPEDAGESFVPGLLFFMRLPGPKSALSAFNDLVLTLERLQSLLGGEQRDSHHQPLLPQTLASLRDQVQRFERQHQRRA